MLESIAGGARMWKDIDGEFQATLKELRGRIEKLRKEKASLLEEIENLKIKVGRIRLKEELRFLRWRQMTPKQICSIILIGIILTSVIALVCFFIDPLVFGESPLSTLDKETELVSYLRDVQDYENIHVGLHGYDHKCPICGATDHELTCLNDPEHERNVPLKEIRDRIEAGLAIFNRSGLKAECYVFPGNAYDERALYVLRSKGFTIIKRKVAGWGEVDEAIGPSMFNLTFDFWIKEYTWMWRNTTSENQFRAALEELMTDRPIQILMHVQDFNDQTRNLLEQAVLHAGTTLIRCDDITFNNDLEKTKQLVEFAKAHNINLILAVIPTSKKAIHSPFLSVTLKTTWMLFLGLFVFPITVMIPWAFFFKLKREKLLPTWNPHYPTVSLILPAYNEEKTISKSIERGLNQNYKGNIEIIVIDDGSTDKTYQIAKKYADEYNNVKIIQHEENKGKSHALNAGFAEAKGDISIISDTDSILAPDLVSKMVPHFKDPKVGMVAGMIVIENEKNLLTRLQQIEYLFTQMIIRFCQSSHRNVLICPGAATAVRTHIAKRILLTDRTVAEDADFTFSVWKDGWKISQEPEALSYTEAPENFKGLLNQRKRWFYGSLQTIAIHKWATKKGNLWVIKAWLDCLLCPFTLLSFVSIPSMIYILYASSFPLCLFTNGFLTFAVFGITTTMAIKLYNRGEKIKLALLVPIYIIYQVILNFLLIYLVFAFITRKGIYVRHGGKIIHAI